MVGYALSGFVDGFFRGRDMKNSWEDRKLDRERQTRLDKMAEERHGAIMAEYGREAADWDRENKFRNDELAMLQGGLGVQTTAGAAADARDDRVSTKAPSMSLGAVPEVVLPAGGNRFAAMMDRTSPDSELAARAKAQAQTSARRAPDATPGPVVAGHNMPGSTFRNDRDVGASMLRTGIPESVAPMMMPPGNQGMGVAPQVAPQAGPVRRLPDGTIVAPAPSAAIADELYQQGPVGTMFIPPDRQVAPSSQPSAPPSVDPSRAAVEARAREAAAAELDRRQRAGQPDYSHQFLQPGGLGADIAEVGRRVPRALGGVVEQAANAVNAVVNPYVPYATGYEFPTSSPQAAPAPGAPAAAATPPATPAPAAAPRLDPEKPVPPMLAAVPPQTAQVDSQTPVSGTAQQAGRPDVAAATDVAVGAALDFGPGPLGAVSGKATPAQYDRAATAFSNYYSTEKAQEVIDFYVRNGRFDKAAEFRDYIDDTNTQKALKSWSKFAFALTVGDQDKAAESYMDYLKGVGMLDAAVEFVRDKSKILKDKDGNITGAEITLRDSASGTSWTQTFDSLDDIVAVGAAALPGRELFEQKQKEAEAMREAALGIQEDAMDRMKLIEEKALEIYAKEQEQSRDTTWPRDKDGNPLPARTYQSILSELLESAMPTGAPVDPSRDPNTNYRE